MTPAKWCITVATSSANKPQITVNNKSNLTLIPIEINMLEQIKSWDYTHFETGEEMEPQAAVTAEAT